MSDYLIRRLLLIPVLLLGITIMDFAFINLAPGDPVGAMMNPMEMVELTQEGIDAQREALGLNKPIPVRYVLWLKEIFSGNLGYSMVMGQSVAQLMTNGIKNTITLMVLSLIGTTIVGIAFGIISALKPYSFVDYALTALSFTGVAMPSFFFALILIVVFAVQLGWFPTSGIVTPGVPPSLVDKLRHMALPLAALSVGGAAGMLRYTRSSMLEVLREDYVVTARSKGLAESVINIRHALKNALLPLITLLGLSIPSLFGGSMIVETMFSYPGIGMVMVSAARFHDYPVMMGGFLMSGTLILFSSLIADLSYAVIDPRIRY